MANYNSRGAFNGLGTTSLGVPSTSNYEIVGKITLPTISEGETINSALVVTVNVNGGSAIYTSNPGDKGFQFKRALSANDILNFVLTSSASVDKPLNVIKYTINISEI